jgi:hypothetical protein
MLRWALQGPMTLQQATAAPAAATDRLPLPLRAALLFTVLSVTVFSRFGLRIGGHPFDISFIALYVLAITLLWNGWARVAPTSLMLYVTGLVVALSGWIVNQTFGAGDAASAGSLALLVAIYLPFTLVMQPPGELQKAWRWTAEAFGAVAFFCALAGIAQFYLQFAIHDPWLMDFRPYLPWKLRGPDGYNTVIPVGRLFFKSNGFFLREPSHFSFLMALAILLELQLRRRAWRIATLGFALLLTYSGTGLFALSLGLMFPLGRRTLVQLLLFALAGFFVLTVLGDALNLGFTLGRASEFGSERSSAYARYVAPVRVVLDEIGSTPWAVLLGHGPGTIQRTAHGLQTHDPTWAKLVFEYGLLGCLAFVALVACGVARSGAPTPVRAVLFTGWLVMGGYLLSPEVCAMLYLLLCGWPGSSGATRAAAARAEAS